MSDTPQDAKFEDGGEEALRLLAMDQEDLQVLSTLVQDAVFPAAEMAWDAKHRRFSLLLNRFRWEDVNARRSTRTTCGARPIGAFRVRCSKSAKSGY